MNWEPNPKGVASVTLGELSESICHRPWQGGLSRGTGYMGEEGLSLLLGKLGLAVKKHQFRLESLSHSVGLGGEILPFLEGGEEGPQSRPDSLLLKDPREKASLQP